MDLRFASQGLPSDASDLKEHILLSTLTQMMDPIQLCVYLHKLLVGTHYALIMLSDNAEWYHWHNAGFPQKFQNTIPWFSLIFHDQRCYFHDALTPTSPFSDTFPTQSINAECSNNNIFK